MMVLFICSREVLIMLVSFFCVMGRMNSLWLLVRLSRCLAVRLVMLRNIELVSVLLIACRWFESRCIMFYSRFGLFLNSLCIGV